MKMVEACCNVMESLIEAALVFIDSFDNKPALRLGDHTSTTLNFCLNCGRETETRSKP